MITSSHRHLTPARIAWIKHVFFTLTEHGAVRVLDAVMTLVLIRELTAPDFGLFSVYQSWVGMALLVLPSLELALYRDYARLKQEGLLAQELAVYRTFNVFKIILTVLIVVTLSLIPQNNSWTVRFSLLTLAFALPLSQALYGFLREPLRFEMKQGLVALISAFQRIFLLGSILVAGYFYPGSAVALSASALLIYAAFGFIWSIPSKAEASHLSSRKEVWGKAVRILGTTVLWIHINGVISQFMQTFDTFCLNLFKTDLSQIALYSISLKAANFFQILPVALINPFGVFLGRRHGHDQAQNQKTETSYMLRFSGFFLILCSLLFIIGNFVEAPLLRFVGKTKVNDSNIQQISTYFRWQLAGVLLLCFSYPLSTYLGARASLSKIFKNIFLPWTLLSAVIYISAAHEGLVATAKANVVVYGVLLSLLLLFFKSYSQASRV